MLIQLGIINYKSIIHFLYPVFYHLRFRIGGTRNNCFQLFLNYLSYSLAGIIYLIVVYRTNTIKTKNKDNDVNLNRVDQDISIGSFDDLKNDVIIKEIEKKKTKEKRVELCKLKLSVIGLTILNFLPMFLETMLLNSSLGLDADIKESSTIFFETLFYVSFSRLILHQKIYNHQLFSLAMILGCMSFIFAVYLFEKNLPFFDIMNNLLFFSFVFLLYGLCNVLEKKVLISFIISPYYLMFSLGFLSLIALIIYEIITWSLLGENWEFSGVIKQIKNDISIKFLLLSLFSAIIGFFWLGGIILTIYYFSPCHFIINEVLTQLVTNLLDSRFDNYNKLEKIICYVAYIIIVFFTLVYNEIIIINIDFISKDTRKNIIQRQYNDVNSVMRDDDGDKSLELYTKTQAMDILPIEEEEM